MEDPAKEVKDVIRGLVCKPSLDQQEIVLRRYFAPDCKFSHLYANVEGLEDLISLYQLANTLIHYQSVDFLSIVYDSQQNMIATRINIHAKPWFAFFKDVQFEIHALLELEDFRSEDGRLLKLIKVQRDYFQRSLVLIMIPILGEIYNSGKIRTLLGRIDAVVFRVFKNLFKTFM